MATTPRMIMVELNALLTEDSPAAHLLELSSALNHACSTDPRDGSEIHGLPAIKLASIVFDFLVAEKLLDGADDKNPGKALGRTRLNHYLDMIRTMTLVMVDYRDTLRNELEGLGLDTTTHPFSCVLEVIDVAWNNTRTRDKAETEDLGPRPTPQ